jgi:hypothetical protein
MSTQHPFYYGGIAEDEYFCNRQEEIQSLKNDIQAGLNILIYAPRRFGKTSLILNTISQIDYKYVFLDLMSITDEKEFINEYFNAISKSLETTTDKVVSFFKKILKIKPNIGVEFNMDGSPVYSLSFNISESNAVLREVLDIPYKYAKYQNQKILVVFDEFQEISRLGIEEKLRSVIQLHGNNVSYVFSGSKKSVMRRIFLNNTQAFYKSVKHLPIREITDEQWLVYIQKGFSAADKHIHENHVHDLLKVSKGFPYYTQQIAYELFNITEKLTTDDLLKQAIESILLKEEDLFLLEWDNLSTNQKKMLKLIVKSGGKNVYYKDKMDQFGLSGSTIKKAVEGLLEKDVIDRLQGQYYLQDPLFEHYIKMKF